MIPNNKKFILLKSQLIINNQHEFINEIYKAKVKHQIHYPDKDLTFSYNIYNAFGITSPSKLFYQLFEELKPIILNYVNSEFVWLSCWINVHDNNGVEEVLDWHSHDFPYHGYISINPHKTRTAFENRNAIEAVSKYLKEGGDIGDRIVDEIVEFEIENEIGNIYLGPGNIQHKVFIDEVFDTPRVTLGFVVIDEDKASKMDTHEGFSSLIPLIK